MGTGPGLSPRWPSSCSVVCPGSRRSGRSHGASFLCVGSLREKRMQCPRLHQGGRGHMWELPCAVTSPELSLLETPRWGRAHSGKRGSPAVPRACCTVSCCLRCRLGRSSADRPPSPADPPAVGRASGPEMRRAVQTRFRLPRPVWTCGPPGRLLCCLPAHPPTGAVASAAPGLGLVLLRWCVYKPKARPSTGRKVTTCSVATGSLEVTAQCQPSVRAPLTEGCCLLS